VRKARGRYGRRLHHRGAAGERGEQRGALHCPLAFSEICCSAWPAARATAARTRRDCSSALPDGFLRVGVVAAAVDLQIEIDVGHFLRDRTAQLGEDDQAGKEEEIRPLPVQVGASRKRAG